MDENNKIILDSYSKKTPVGMVRNSLVLAEPIPEDVNPAFIYLCGLKPSGRETQRQALNIVAREIAGCGSWRDLNWGVIRVQHVELLRSVLIEKKYKPAMLNKCIYGFRAVMKRAWMLKLISSDDYAFIREVKGVEVSKIPAGRELSGDEISALMGACAGDDTPAGVRDSAILGCLYSAGLRRSEVSALQYSDFTKKDGKLLIHGKGSKERLVYLSNGSFDAMTDWLELRGSGAGSLFLAINKAGVIYNKGISDETVYQALLKRGAQAGVKDFSTHDLRRTFVSELLGQGVDITTVSKLCGHESVVTTSRYDRRPEDAKRSAVMLIHLPYTKRSK